MASGTRDEAYDCLHVLGNRSSRCSEIPAQRQARKEIPTGPEIRHDVPIVSDCHRAKSFVLVLIHGSQENRA